MESISGKPVEAINKNEKKVRLPWIDMARGFALLLVLVGHSETPTHLKHWLYLFHVPLFFFISGYVFNWEKYRDFKTFIRGRYYSLVIPALVFHIILSAISLTLHFNWKNMLKIIFGTFIQLRGSMYYGSRLWFIICLIVTELLFWCMMHFLKKTRDVIIALVSFSVIGYLYALLIGKMFPWSLDVMCMAIGFYGAGYFCRNGYSGFFDKITVISLAPLYLLITLAVYFVNESVHQWIDLYDNKFGIYPLFYIGAFAGILMTVSVFRALPPLRPLIFIGCNTLVYYAFDRYSYKLSTLILPFRVWTVNICFQVFLLALTAMLFNKFLPIAVGKRRVTV